MKFIIGTKKHMVQYFSEDGKAFPATLIEAGPITVTALRTKDKEGYNAVQVGYGNQKKERLNKPILGHLGETGAFKTLKEFSMDEAPALNKGDVISATVFEKGDKVRVTGLSKSKGFQGVVKRHNFKGGPRSHGQKHSEREPGSIGGGLRTRVPKGMRMAGRTGGDVTTVTNLEVLEVNSDTNTMLIKGALPGRRGTLLKIIG